MLVVELWNVAAACSPNRVGNQKSFHPRPTPSSNKAFEQVSKAVLSGAYARNQFKICRILLLGVGKVTPMDGVPYGQLTPFFRRHWLCLFLAVARKGAQLDASSGRRACLAQSFANAAGIARMMKKFKVKYPKLFL